MDSIIIEQTPATLCVLSPIQKSQQYITCPKSVFIVKEVCLDLCITSEAVIRGVFDTLELANKFVEKYKPTLHYMNDYEIEEYRLNVGAYYDKTEKKYREVDWN